MKKDDKPGLIARFSLNLEVTYASAVFIIVIILAFFYWWNRGNSEAQNLIFFVSVSFGSVAAFGTMLYLANQLRIQLGQYKDLRERELRGLELRSEEQKQEARLRRLETAMEYIKRWNSPEFWHQRQAFSECMREFRGKSAQEIDDTLEGDFTKRGNLIAILCK